ncbi:RinA family protein [Lactococcus formosensis]|uniref:RinA family protein n=1 Tax=Lactococcus formosensis TaxID=1281486 RepID=UPI0038533229
MADKLNKIIGDYVNGRIQARIQSIESSYMYKAKSDNLGIRTAYSGGAEPESKTLSREAMEEDEELIRLKEIVKQFSLWYEPLIHTNKEIIKLKHLGYGGVTWSMVEMDLRHKGIFLSIRQIKFIYYRFRKDIEVNLLHVL